MRDVLNFLEQIEHADYINKIFLVNDAFIDWYAI